MTWLWRYDTTQQYGIEADIRNLGEIELAALTKQLGIFTSSMLKHRVCGGRATPSGHKGTVVSLTTTLQIKVLKPRAQRYDVSVPCEDEEGNAVSGGQIRVYPNGRKVFRGRNNGDPITIGPFPAISLAAFRERMEMHHQLRGRGIDPKEHLNRREKAHRVPLSELAIELLRELKDEQAEQNRESAYVSPTAHSKRRGDASMEEKSLTRAAARNQCGLEHWTPHDLRRTAATHMNRLGINFIWVEKVLNQKLQGMLKVYNQHPYEDEKRAAQDGVDMNNA